ncbi:hypothetical protein TWF730_005165 [Orbilia blumenaviensis]|uniref:Uncharacterized protein n=1 Tax=Orbilia blumenaviensis TaxID=1796055 RepID=A0AAV9VIW5_9PEZI
MMGDIRTTDRSPAADPDRPINTLDDESIDGKRRLLGSAGMEIVVVYALRLRFIILFIHYYTILLFTIVCVRIAMALPNIHARKSIIVHANKQTSSCRQSQGRMARST